MLRRYNLYLHNIYYRAILSLGLTAEAAMDALKISKDEQAKYLALL